MSADKSAISIPARRSPATFVRSCLIVVVLIGLVAEAVRQALLGFPYLCFVAGAAVLFVSVEVLTDHRDITDRLKQTTLQVWLNSSLILAMAMSMWSSVFVPTGDPMVDELVKPRADFMLFYSAALQWQESPGQLYEMESQAASQRRATGLPILADDVDFLPWGYPPIVAVLFVPFTFLPYEAAYLLMMLTNLVLLGVVLWVLSDELGLTADQNQVLTLSAAGLLPLYMVLVHGQVSFFVVLFLTLVITNLRHARNDRAGFWGGLIALKPTLFLIIPVWFAIRGNWVALKYALATSGLLALLSIAVVGPDGTVGYVEMSTLMASDTLTVTHPRDMGNLRAVTEFLGLSTLAWVTAVSVILVLLGHGRHRRLSDWDYAGFVLAIALTARYIFFTDLSIGLIAIALILSGLRRRLTPTRRVAVYASSLVPAGYYAWVSGPERLHWPIVPLFLFALFIWTIKRSRSDDRYACDPSGPVRSMSA